MDIERLLGKLLEEVTHSGGDNFRKKESKKKYKKEQYYKERGHERSGSLLDSLTGGLGSGKGLLTAIGLGVGAYEIYRGSRQAQTIGGPSPQPMLGQAPPPPPPPGRFQAPPTVAAPYAAAASPATASATPEPEPAPVRAKAPVSTSLEEREVARRLIQVMVGAAHADGILDAEEEKEILDRLRGLELSAEEKMYLATELHRPRGVAELCAGVDNPGLAQTMYAVAASTVLVDTEQERRWLDELGAALGISPEMRQFIEENH